MHALYLQVKNWDKFQHYHNRPNPPHWIKMYPTLLQDYSFRQLPELERGRLLSLWLLAGQLRNKIPYDPRYVAEVIGAKKVNLDMLVSLGWLEVVDEDGHLVNAEDVSTHTSTHTSTSRSRRSLDKEQNREEVDKSRTDDETEEPAFDELEHSIVRLLATLTDADTGTELQVRTRVTSYGLAPADVEEAREAATSDSANSPCAVAMSVLKARGERKREAREAA